jgi:hypothetical protein
MKRQGTASGAALRAGVCRNTASKYLKTDLLPSELVGPRTWRTRSDPFAEDWSAIEALLAEEPGLEAKTIFEDLKVKHPDRYTDGQLRTLQRRMRRWRAQHGPNKELWFPQDHRPGEALQTDFTAMAALEITIAGEPYPHLLCHCVLPCSDWSWATPCRSESMAALRSGLQAALTELGHVPRFHQTDNSTAATHRLDTSKRAFNEKYLELMNHLGMSPRTIGVGCSEQNGDVESHNGALKRYIEQQLLLRGSRDFATREEYRGWLRSLLVRRNNTRGPRLQEELDCMRKLQVAPLPEYDEIEVRVTSGGMIRAKSHYYSVPSRLRDELVQVRLYDERVEVYYAGDLQESFPRLQGKLGHHVQYRHVVGGLLRKPGAFRCYRYREAMFPTATFRRAHEVLAQALPDRKADIEYLRVLELAAMTLETSVESALREVLDAGQQPSADKLREMIAPSVPEIPRIDELRVDLRGYDELIGELEEVPA